MLGAALGASGGQDPREVGVPGDTQELLKVGGSLGSCNPAPLPPPCGWTLRAVRPSPVAGLGRSPAPPCTSSLSQKLKQADG